MKDTAIQTQEVYKTLIRFNPEKTPQDILIIRLPKVKNKERILKTTIEKKEREHNEAPICLAADFSVETLQTRRE